MDVEECKKCKYHYRCMYDDVLCGFSGGYDYRVIAENKKGKPVVLMCPKENIPVATADRISVFNFLSRENIS